MDREGSKKGKRVVSHFKDAKNGFGADVDGGRVVSSPRQVFSSPISLRLPTDEALLEEGVSYPSQIPFNSLFGFWGFLFFFSFFTKWMQCRVLGDGLVIQSSIGGGKEEGSACGVRPVEDDFS